VPAGTYTTAQSVSLNTTTPGASIRYTTDGATPSETVGTLYAAPITVSATATLKAIAYESGWATSTVASAAYTITGTVATPTFSVPAGTYTTVQSVVLSTTTPGATIRYTTDGSAPTPTTGIAYSAPVVVNASMTLRAIAYLTNWNDSAMASATYTMNLPPADFTMTMATPPTPWLAGMSGTFTFTLAASSTFNDTVTFTSAQMPGGSTVSFAPASVVLAPSGTATVTVTVATLQTENGGVAGYFNPIVTASATSAAHSLTVPLMVQDFGLKLAKQREQVGCTGGPVSVEYTVQPANGADVSSVGVGWVGTYLNPGDSDFSRYTAVNAPAIGQSAEGAPIVYMNVIGIPCTSANRFYARIVAWSGTVRHYAQIEIDQNVPTTADFTVNMSPPSQTLSSPGMARYPIVVNSAFSYSGQVNVSASGTPSGATAVVKTWAGVVVQPQDLTWISAGQPKQFWLEVTTTAGTATGTWPLTVTVSDASITRAAQVALTVGASVQVQRTFATYPAGLPSTVDLVPCTSPCTFTWDSGSSHTVSAPSSELDTSGSQMLFSRWSDGGDIIHPIGAGAAPSNVTATFHGANPQVATAKPHDSALSYYVLNDSSQNTWSYCIGFYWKGQFYCDPYYDATHVSGVGTTKAGVSARLSRTPSAQYPDIASSFDVSFSATNSTTPGSVDLTVTYSGQEKTVASAVQVFDAAPTIVGVYPSSPSSDGGPFSVQITGTNFGAAGSVAVCLLPVGGGPCAQTGDVVPQAGSIQWGLAVIFVTLVPQLGASGPYCLQLSSLGATGTGFIPAPGVSTSGSACTGNIIIRPTLTLTPMDVSGSPGDVFVLTSTTSAASATYAWSLGTSQSGDDPGAFQFVASSCAPGTSCAPVAPDECVGAPSCTAYVQALSPGFANVVVALQTVTSSPPPQSARLRAMTVQITKIWSDQFPGGPVANYLPGDGGPGTGAGLVGNARQLLIVGVRDSRNGDAFPGSGWKGSIKGLVTTSPSGGEALSHILVRVAQGVPLSVPTAGSWATAGLNTPPGGVGGVTSSGVFSIAIDQQLAATDYTVVAGVNRNAMMNQVTDTLTAPQTSTWFYRPCLVTPERNGPCSNGAVRIISKAENIAFEGLALAGGVISFALLPTAADHLTAFARGQAPLLALTAPPSPNSNINTMELLFNTGLVFAAGTSPYAGPIYEYQYANTSTHADRIRTDSDFQSLILETISLHKAEVLAYFSSLPAGSNFTFPAWQAVGCSSAIRAGYVGPCLAGTATGFDETPGSTADQPALFPCSAGPGSLPPGVTPQSLAGRECDLTFSTSTNLNYAFGRAGYNLTVIANVTSVDSSHFDLNNVSLAGYLYDSYQWNPAFSGLLDKPLSNIQAGSDAADRVGQVFRIKVTLDTSSPVVLPYAF
jgi:hypothetical protein